MATTMTGRRNIRKASRRLKRVYAVNLGNVIWERLARLLVPRCDMAVSGVAYRSRQLLHDLERLSPDIVLLDLDASGKLGIRFIKELVKDKKARVLAISSNPSPDAAEPALRAGAAGYILNTEDTDEIVHAIDDVLEGWIYVSDEVLNTLPKRNAADFFRRKHPPQTDGLRWPCRCR
ncbi:MAG TPA: response regulator [Verrucomicrobiae bacterium]|jgi:DNA-binding NarL/FixJ family response regulator